MCFFSNCTMGFMFKGPWTLQGKPFKFGILGDLLREGSHELH